ncbi:MAG: hypothetical protein ACI8U3_002266 [Brevundimonas sp.]|jgi:hypothetical protein|uniref:hypothetical protein n=1 Tax=Brevundimonas sp. TaxID=1871086 RepID=UPI0039E5A9F8
MSVVFARLYSLILAVSLIATANISLAEDNVDFLERLKMLRIQNENPQAIAIIERDIDEEAAGYSFYQLSRTGDGQTNWIVRREFLLGRSENAISWADMSECPQVFGLIDWMERIQIPSIRFSRFQPVAPQGANLTPPIPALHRDLIVLWGRSRQGDHEYVEVTIESRGGVLANWSEALVNDLAPCWKPVPSN